MSHDPPNQQSAFSHLIHSIPNTNFTSANLSSNFASSLFSNRFYLNDSQSDSDSQDCKPDLKYFLVQFSPPELQKQIQKVNQEDSPFKEIEKFFLKSEIRRSSIIRRERQQQQAQIQTLQKIFHIFYNTRGVTFFWVFIIKNPLKQASFQLQQLKKNLLRLWNNKSKSFPISENYIPIFKSFRQAENLFKAKNCMFHVVADLKNAKKLLKFFNSTSQQFKPKLLSVSLYLSKQISQKLNVYKKALKIKESFPKVIGIYDDIQYLTDRAFVDLEDSMQIAADADPKEHLRRINSCLPMFIKLNENDKSQITSYRTNVYRAIKLAKKKYREQKAKKFIDLVKKVFASQKYQLEELEHYLQIDHFTWDPNNKLKHESILKFYTKDCFYHNLTNNLLRVVRNFSEFEPVVLPFNEIYHAISFFYNLTNPFDGNKDRKITSQKLYRGASLKQMEFYRLKEGDYIELMGFPSFSKSEEIVRKKYLKGKNPTLFELTINQRIIPSHMNPFDHGFADLNKLDISVSEYADEEEVLMNALNIYKVKKVTSPEKAPDGIGKVQLQYGAIFDLLLKKHKQFNQQPAQQLQISQQEKYQFEEIQIDSSDDFLTQEEQKIIRNYKYCMEIMKIIKDDDVEINIRDGNLLKAEQILDQQLADTTMSKDQITKIMNKKASLQLKLGKIDQAEALAKKILQNYQNYIDNMPPKNSQQVVQIVEEFQKNRKVFEESQNYEKAKETIALSLKLIDPDKQWLLYSETILKRAKMNFQEHLMHEASKDYKESQKALLEKKQSFDRKSVEDKKNKLSLKYIFLRLIHVIVPWLDNNLEQQEREQLRQIEAQKKQFEEKNYRIYNLLLSINEGLMNIAKILGDRVGYQQRKKVGKGYREQFTQNEAQAKDVFEMADIKVLEGKIENSFGDEENLKQSYKLIKSAIEMIKQKQPFHQKVVEYTKVMGSLKRSEMKKLMQVNQTRSKMQNFLIKPSEMDQSKIQIEVQQSLVQTRQSYDKEKVTELFEQTKSIFIESLDIAKVHHKGNEDHPMVFEIKNEIGQIQYDHAMYEECKQVVSTVFKGKRGESHSEGARAALIIAKVNLAQGEIEGAQVYIKKSFAILEKALVKEKPPVFEQNKGSNSPQNESSGLFSWGSSKSKAHQIYEQIMKLSPIFRETKLLHCRILNKMGESQTALQQIQALLTIGSKKLKDSDGVGYLADIYQHMGNTYVYMKDLDHFLKYCQKAIELRKNYMGQKSIQNALCLCKMAKELYLNNQLDKGFKFWNEAKHIFDNCFKDKQPESWYLFSAKAYRSYIQFDQKEELQSLSEALNLIKQTYSTSHISMFKIQMRLADASIRNRLHEKADNIYRELDNFLQKDPRVKDLLRQKHTNPGKDFSKINQKVAIKEGIDIKLRKITRNISKGIQLEQQDGQGSEKQRKGYNIEKGTPQTKLDESSLDIQEISVSIKEGKQNWTNSKPKPDWYIHY